MTPPGAPTGAARWTTIGRLSILLRRPPYAAGARHPPRAQPNHEDTTMAKGIEPKKDAKKKPAKTMKEKRADKKAKKDAKR